MSDIVLIARAWNFSAERHAKQKRKGEAQEPYVNHLAEVAELVATATEGRDANLVAAAVLHDAVEDTATLHTELASVFNTDIADLVAEVTDDKKLLKEERKKRQVELAKLGVAKFTNILGYRIMLPYGQTSDRLSPPSLAGRGCYFRGRLSWRPLSLFRNAGTKSPYGTSRHSPRRTILALLG